jgi:hypothetical protein
LQGGSLLLVDFIPLRCAVKSRKIRKSKTVEMTAKTGGEEI